MIPRRSVAGLALLASCGAAPVVDGSSEARRYLTDADFRRSELVASLTTTDNAYARRRLERYDTGDARDWARLDAWNPPVAPAWRDDTPRPLAITAEASNGDLDALRALGRVAFWRYPAMLASPLAEPMLRDPARAARYGLRGTDAGGLVRVALADGSLAYAYTCATCHTAPATDGALVEGLANASLDLGALAVDTNPTLAPELIPRLRAWGPGRVDVSTDDAREPVLPPDLRPIRWQRYLHRAGAVRARSMASLAVRIETLLITSHHESVRPPREVALGLALHLDGLADRMPRVIERDATGRGVFSSRCGACHAGDGYAGALIPAEVVGTEASIARSTSRGTGAYRVPSLRGVSQRARLMHDGSIAGIDALLDARREGGHRFGLELSDDERAALRTFLRAL